MAEQDRDRDRDRAGERERERERETDRLFMGEYLAETKTTLKRTVIRSVRSRGPRHNKPHVITAPCLDKAEPEGFDQRAST